MLSITNPTGGALTSLAITAERGTPSSKIPIAIKNLGATTINAAIVAMLAETVSGGGNYETSGAPVVDERQGRFQVTGVDSSGTAGQTVSVTAAQPMGYLANPELPPILPGNIIYADVWIDQPGVSAAGGAIRIKITVANDGSARAVPLGLTESARGVLSGVNSSESVLISGRVVTASGTPDALVHYTAGSWLFNGVEGTDGSGGTLTLNQNDGAAAALVAGEAYIAAISQGASATPTTTKGLKDVAGSALAPSVPLGEQLLGIVKVSYHAGASVISPGDITLSDLTYGRLLVTYPATGLTATVHVGRSLANNFLQHRDVKGDVALTNTATNRIWMEYLGGVTVTTTAAQPSAGALLLRTLTTSGGNVTGDVDERIYVGAAGVLSNHATTHATAGTDPLSPGSIGAATVADLALKADITDPVFLGDPQAPTPSAGDDSVSIATTAYVQGEIALVFTEHFDLFTGDGVSQPPAMSPVPAVNSVPDVYKNGLIQLEGGGLDYTRSGTNDEQVDFTIVPLVGEIVRLKWRG